MSSVMQTYKRFPLNFIKGEGAYLYSDAGKQFIDFGTGISVVNLGHSNPEVSKAIADQSTTLIHTSNLYFNNIQEQLADKISHLSFPSEIFFSNSGAEANEAAIKIARIIGNKKYDGKKYKIITMNDSFHGRTFNTLSATGQDKIKDGFRPTVDFFNHININDMEAVKTACKNGDVVAIMLELVQGEGGLSSVDKDYLKSLRTFCDKNDILLIFDEIQTGIGRTGKMFAFQKYGVTPDIMTLAKALGNGLPIGATVAKPEIAKYLSFGTHGSTFGGNFLACAAANTVVDIISKETFLNGVEEKSIYLRSKLSNIFGTKGNLKGIGLLLGVEFSNITNADFIEKCHNAGLLLIPAGNNTVRIYPPLNVTQETLDEAITIIESVFNSFPPQA